MTTYKELNISEKEWFSLSHEQKMEKLVAHEESKLGWKPYIRMDCGGAWKSTRRQSDNGWKKMFPIRAGIVIT